MVAIAGRHKGNSEHKFDIMMKHLRDSWGRCQSTVCSQKMVSVCRRCCTKCANAQAKHFVVDISNE